MVVNTDILLLCQDIQCMRVAKPQGDGELREVHSLVASLIALVAQTLKH